MGLLNYTTAKINELLAKVAALPAKVMDGDTKIPSKTSDLENDSKFVKETGLKTVNGNSLLGTGNITIEGGSGGGTADSVDWANVNNKPGWVNSPTKPSYTASEVGALPSGTSIPTKTSELTNDSKFVKEAGLKTINGQSLLGTGNIFISGGSGSGSGEGGGGNVNVTNAAELKTTKNYVFKPSGDGLTEGTFSTLPTATKNEEGLMSAKMAEKLSKIKEIYNFPIAVLDLTSASTSDEILTAFGIDPIQENGTLVYLMSMLSAAQYEDYEESLPTVFIGNHECSIYAAMTSNVIEMELSYISQNGKIKVIKVSATEGSDTYTYAIKNFESGDDTFFLNKKVYKLSSGSTSDEIKEAFGGDEGINDFENAISLRKNIAIESRTKPGTGDYYSLVCFSTFTKTNWRLWFDRVNAIKGEKFVVFISKNAKGLEVKNFYQNGYIIDKRALNLTSDSDSDSISASVGGETGLRNIINAVKDGNRLLLEGTFNELYYSVFLNCAFSENDNGDAMISLSGTSYGLWGGFNSICNIYYTKADNTFSCTIMN